MRMGNYFELLEMSESIDLYLNYVTRAMHFGSCGHACCDVVAS